MYKVTDIFSELASLLVPLLGKAVDANAASRDEIVTVISDMASEVEEGLGLVATYIRGAAYLDSKQEIGKHFFEAEKTLYRYHSEFKICKGLRLLRDRFSRMFDAMPHSVQIGERKRIETLLSELQLDESLIVEEFGDFWRRIHAALEAQPLDEVKALIRAELESVQDKKRRIQESARTILQAV
ncbi:hypothetical protein QTH87_05950 [Variovorax sp. J22P168]|uniref:hypothetical protein n=1 Tax=Variovorax jilinensis TaxID=3053513 RepID=UPI00257540F8|nr:hypothetical protein [Variovorax sp. J22P168]MDM0011981.1 hypothetical protein [Variovorax sp. J22P168]